MNAGLARQLAALQRIAAFSATVRGHELGEWHTRKGCSSTHCIRCRAQLRVRFPAIQPEVDGTAVERLCHPLTAAGKAA